MGSKKKVLALVDWYLPGYKAGGPIRSVSNMIAHLGDDLDFSVVTTDTDYGETMPYPDAKSDQWNKLPDGTRVYYFSSRRLSYSGVKKILRSEEYDILYLNSFFSVYFTLVPLILTKWFIKPKRVILAPRGMLSPGALKLKSTKKKLFIFISKLLGLYSHVVWHSSANLEADEIRSVFGNSINIKIAGNLVQKQVAELKEMSKMSGEMTLVFASRIARKKNLLGVFELLRKIDNTGNLSFDIYGPVDERDYWRQCQREMADMPEHVKVKYRGEVNNADLQQFLSDYHFMILPTLGENFGHIILESLSAGTPVIISDTTPWRDLEQSKAGWDLKLDDTSGFVKVLERCIAMNEDEYREWAQGAHNYAKSYIENDEIVKQNLALFANA